VQDAAAQLADWPGSAQQSKGGESLVNVHAHALAALRRVADAVPHVVLLDDAHRLDHASRELLRFLATNVRDLGVVVVVGARAAGTADDAAATAADLQQARLDGGVVQILPLRELGPEEVTTLVKRRFAASQEFELLAQRIHDLTQGHPFFVSEALQHLLLTGQLRRERQGWRLLAASERKLLPRMADTILSEHVTAAREEDRDIYEVLALFPAGAQLETLSEVLEQSADAVRAALERGVRIGLLAAGRDVHRFVHELLREACAARCPAATARRYHRRIADALAGTAAEAHHRLAAEENSEQARACYVREAQSYESRGAPWEALRYYTPALDAAPDGPDADDLALRVAALRIQVGQAEDAAALLLQRLAVVRKPLLRARYLQLIGRAYQSLGRSEEALFHLRTAQELFRQHADVDEKRAFTEELVRLLIQKEEAVVAAEECTAALESLAADDEPKARARLLLLMGEAQRKMGHHPAAEEHCRQALGVLKPLGRVLELAKAYTQIGTNCLQRGDFEQAVRYCRAALKVHTELGDLQGMKNALNNLGTALMRADRLEEAIVSHQQSLELKRRLADRPGEGNSLNNLGNLYERQGDHRRAFQCYRRGIAIYRRLNRPRELAILYNNMGEVHMRLGTHPKALRLLERARACSAGLGGAYIAQIIAYNLGGIHLSLLDPQAAIRTLSPMLPTVQKAGLRGLEAAYHAMLALAYACADDASQTAVHTRQALELFATGIEDESRLEALLDLAEAAAYTSGSNATETWAEECESLARRTGRPHGRVRALRLIAHANQRRGAWDLAESRLDMAAEICRREGFRYELARVSKSLGHLHWDLGLRARAETDFERCVRLLDELKLRTEVGLTYLEWAQLSSGGNAGA
jgi:tetratricopeptide (TPR) repeat protein